MGLKEHANSPFPPQCALLVNAMYRFGNEDGGNHSRRWEWQAFVVVLCWSCNKNSNSCFTGNGITGCSLYACIL